MILCGCESWTLRIKDTRLSRSCRNVDLEEDKKDQKEVKFENVEVIIEILSRFKRERELSLIINTDTMKS